MTDTHTSSAASRPLQEQVASLFQLIHGTFELLARSEQTTPSKAVENLQELAQQVRQLERQLERYESSRANLRALVDIGQVINSSLDLNEVLRIVMDTIIRLTEAERGFLMLREAGGELSIRVARNWEQESIDPADFAISRTVVNQVITGGQPVLTTNAQADPRFGGQHSVVAYNLRSILCVPLAVKEELIGLIYADNRIRAGLFSETQRSLLAAFANQAAVAIENARLFESVRRSLAEVSELKGLMDNVFTSIVSGVLTVGIDNQVILCNLAAQDILGCSEHELVGHVLEAALPTLAPSLARHIEAVWRTDQDIVGLELNPNLPCRGPVALSINLSPLKDAAHTTQGVAIVIDDLTEKKHLEGQRRLFERMISPAVIDQLDPNKLQLGGRRAELTVLFADLRDFTPFSEGLSPEELVTVLNRYLAAAADAVLAHQGTVDKFQGDAVMAWFNAPIPQEDHTLRAVRAALDLQKAVDALWEELPPKYHLSFGVGIHFGEAVLGLVGTEERLEYTAIGDVVNTAKRIQEGARGGQVLVSAEAHRWVAGQVLTRPVETIQVKGKRAPIQVFEITGLRGEGA